MNIKEILNSADGSRHFSFEVLPPLKGTGTERLFSTIEKFKEFNPAYINITTHHSEYVYREVRADNTSVCACAGVRARWL